MKHYKVHQHIRTEVEFLGLQKVPAISFVLLTIPTLVFFLSIGGCIMVGVYYLGAKASQNIQLNFENLPTKLNN